MATACVRPSEPAQAEACVLPPRVETVPLGGNWPLESTQVFLLRRRLEQLQRISGFERLVCLDACRIDPHPHQHQAALRVLRDMRGRALLADEVGLGKTIEAGLVLKELVVRGLAHRLLVLAPASLTLQWQEELSLKFDETFHVVKHPDDWTQGRLIASLELARQPRHQASALAQAFDLVIVDEAHKLKTRTTQSHRFVSRLNTRFLLLLTATPVMNDLTELYALVNLLVEGGLGTPREFEARHMDASDPRLPLQEDVLRARLASVMVRHRRGAVGVCLPPRRAAIYHLQMPPAERRLYLGLTAYIRQELAAHPGQGQLRLLLGVLQRGLTSTPAAVAATLGKLRADSTLDPASRSRLADFQAQASELLGSRKLEAVGELLESHCPGKVLIFTEFRRSQTVLAEYLAKRGLEVVLFHGSLDAAARQAAVTRFREAARVMISTESGQEGLNLQFCQTLINFDLPWNPMRVEQRIGRLHRLGQTRPVTIINLCYQETIEAAVLDLLVSKIRLFELVVGELDVILGESEGVHHIEAWLQQAWSQSSDDQDFARSVEALGEAVRRARGRYDEICRAGEALSRVAESTGVP
ncbi:MAG: SNF2-related protein [Candidatus Sericytochromatia bacterium]|nr:SNF2-related protein [Candidatus Sericytochromatia bacterium]